MGSGERREEEEKEVMRTGPQSEIHHVSTFIWFKYECAVAGGEESKKEWDKT